MERERIIREFAEAVLRKRLAGVPAPILEQAVAETVRLACEDPSLSARVLRIVARMNDCTSSELSELETLRLELK